jgi:hypothetical protein
MSFDESSYITNFQRLFAQLKDWCDNDSSVLYESAVEDRGIQQLIWDILRNAGRIQKSERSERDLFTGPVDPKFIFEWRDFEERFAITLLDICANYIKDKSEYFFSLEYYEQPDHWELADFKAINQVRSLDATIIFATAQAEYNLYDVADFSWSFVNINAMPAKVLDKFKDMAKLLGEQEDAYENLKNSLQRQLKYSHSEAERKNFSDLIKELMLERFNDNKVRIEELVKDSAQFWETFKYETGFSVRDINRRRMLIPFVLFPRHVSRGFNNSEFSSVYQNLRQAQDAFIFGAPAAALALMRSVMEMVVRDFYGASGSKLDELIDSIAANLPSRASAPALHRLRRLANRVLHGEVDRFSRQIHSKRDFEQEIVLLIDRSLIFIYIIWKFKITTFFYSTMPY